MLIHFFFFSVWDCRGRWSAGAWCIFKPLKELICRFDMFAQQFILFVSHRFGWTSERLEHCLCGVVVSFNTHAWTVSMHSSQGFHISAFDLTDSETISIVPGFSSITATALVDFSTGFWCYAGATARRSTIKRSKRHSDKLKWKASLRSFCKLESDLPASSH